MNGLNSNYLEGNSPVCVAEADEFDRSFLRMDPTCAIITSIDSDHLDIYGDAQAYRSAFQTFREKVQGPCKRLLFSLLRSGLRGALRGPAVVTLQS